jgi:hypothetical protein
VFRFIIGSVGDVTFDLNCSWKTIAVNQLSAVVAHFINRAGASHKKCRSVLVSVELSSPGFANEFQGEDCEVTDHLIGGSVSRISRQKQEQPFKIQSINTASDFEHSKQ